MLESSRFAFKEWAVVCEALHVGQQSLILRKGGIHEGRDGFRVDHHEFWLYPTDFHQQPEVLAPQAQPLLAEVLSRPPGPGTILFRNYVTVEEVIEIRDAAVLPRLSGLHAWSDSTLQTRFQYRTPMLFALLVRTYRLAEPVPVAESSHFAGCRSWVELPQELPTAPLVPVLTDEEHAASLNRIRQAVAT